MTRKDPTVILNLIAQTIYDKKGSNILALDVREFSSITDYVVIAEGNVDRHVVAIASSIEKAAEEIGEKPIYIEGMQTGDWIVLDFIGVMVHLFMPGLRERYQLEQLWKEGQIVDLQINISEDPKISYSSRL